MVFKKKKVEEPKPDRAELAEPWQEDEFWGTTNKTELDKRTFDTGATRDTDSGKFEYGGFFSPEVLRRRAAYMHEHRFLPDGTLRSSSNWKRGIPMDVYLESFLRHAIDIWEMHVESKEDGGNAPTKLMEDAICAAMFNLEGYLFEFLKADL